MAKIWICALIPHKKLVNSLVVGALSLSIITMAHASSHLSPFYAGASFGYNSVSGTGHETGGVLGRLAFGAEGYQSPHESITWGIELGAQSGNDIQLNAPLAVVGLYGPAIRATLEPTLDVLLTVRNRLLDKQPWGIFLKAGASYRDLRLLYNDNSNDQVQTVAPEVQAGITYQVTRHARLELFYQGIYGNNANLTREENGTHVHGIPTQQAGFLGLEYRL